MQNTTRCLLGCTPTTKKLDNIVESVEAELMINVSVRTSTDALLRSFLSLPEAVLTKKQVGAAVLWKNVSTPRVHGSIVVEVQPLVERTPDLLLPFAEHRPHGHTGGPQNVSFPRQTTFRVLSGDPIWGGRRHF